MQSLCLRRYRFLCLVAAVLPGSFGCGTEVNPQRSRIPNDSGANDLAGSSSGGLCLANTERYLQETSDDAIVSALSEHSPTEQEVRVAALALIAVAHAKTAGTIDPALTEIDLWAPVLEATSEYKTLFEPCNFATVAQQNASATGGNMCLANCDDELSAWRYMKDHAYEITSQLAEGFTALQGSDWVRQKVKEVKSILDKTEKGLGNASDVAAIARDVVSYNALEAAGRISADIVSRLAKSTKPLPAALKKSSIILTAGIWAIDNATWYGERRIAFEDCKELQTLAMCRCGNGRLDDGEECEPGQYRNETCETRGYDAGDIWCSGACSFQDDECCRHKCNIGETECRGDGHLFECVDGPFGCRTMQLTEFDSAQCVSECGNQLAEKGEVCDGPDLHGATCEMMGFDHGDLSCQADCNGFDMSACVDCECILDDTICVDGLVFQCVQMYECTEWFHLEDCDGGYCDETHTACEFPWAILTINEGAERTYDNNLELRIHAYSRKGIAAYYLLAHDSSVYQLVPPQIDDPGWVNVGGVESLDETVKRTPPYDVLMKEYFPSRHFWGYSLWVKDATGAIWAERRTTIDYVYRQYVRLDGSTTPQNESCYVPIQYPTFSPDDYPTICCTYEAPLATPLCPSSGLTTWTTGIDDFEAYSSSGELTNAFSVDRGPQEYNCDDRDLCNATAYIEVP